MIDHDPVKYFPADRMQDLLFRGFIVPGKQNSPRIEERLNLRDILITMLMHYGGLRVSEPFHLFLHDVTHDDTDPGSALVRVFHPSLGQAPADLRDAKGKPVACDRTTYLRDKHGLQPRTEYKSSHTLHAGWKGNALDSKQKFMHVHWAPLWAGSLFWKLWVFYMAQRDQFNPGDHPYAFVTREGKPYSIEAYEDAHANAIKRIGLVSAKALGTTPHGHRHAYGQRLSDLHLDAKFLMKALHHKSLESQIVYTEPDRVKLNRAIDAALKVKQLEDSQRNCERNDVPFLKGRELETLTKHTETQALTVTKLRNDLAATYHLLGRSIQIANDFQNKSVQLVANGSMVDLKLGFIETKSEFHQLEVVCENAVIHPNPDADFATIRRAQMIDAMLRFNGMDPVLMHLTPEQQLLAGNAVMKLIQARTGSIEGSLPFAECRAKLKNIGLLHDDVVNEIAQISAEVPAKELIDHAKAKYILSPPKEEINDAS